MASNFIESNSIKTDQENNCYITGNYRIQVTFGYGEANETSFIDSNGLDNIFIAKYNSNGNLIWAKTAGGNSYDEGHSIAVDSKENSYVTGFIGDTAIFGLNETNETTLINNGFQNIFVAKFDCLGNLEWVKRTIGTSYDYGSDLDLDGYDNIYLTGYFRDSTIFDPGGTNEQLLVSFGWNDIFIAKYNNSGNLIWVRQAGGLSTV